MEEARAEDRKRDPQRDFRRRQTRGSSTSRLERGHEMRERRCDGARDLRAIVPETNFYGVIGIRLADEMQSFVGGIDAALQREASLGIGGQRRVVIVARCA